MPTNKKRVGFIPRSDVLKIINKLSIQNNLSNSKIINLLVEEALFRRGLYRINNESKSYEANDCNLLNEMDILNKEIEKNITFESESTYKKFNNDDIYKFLDRDIYIKFLMFLEFQEKMERTKKSIRLAE